MNGAGRGSRKKAKRVHHGHWRTAPSNMTTRNVVLCALPGCVRPRWDRNGVVFEYCSKTHAWEADGRRASPSRASVGRVRSESDYCSHKHFVQGENQRTKECYRAGCARDAWVDRDTGEVLEYCGSRCAATVGLMHMVGQGQCSLPGCTSANMERNKEPNVDRTFRGGTTSASDFELSVSTHRQADYGSVKDQFLSKWMKPLSAQCIVTVARIFTIKSPEDVRQKYEDYRRRITNVERRFHGTSCSSSCFLFMDLKGDPCGERECSVCSICTHGFKLGTNVGRTARQAQSPLRFGDGLYFSSVSGKANGYAFASEKINSTGRIVRCMFVASVAMGKAYKTFEAGLDGSMCSPPGYDAVVGEVREVGPALSYDELVVCREDAAIPTHLIVYHMS